MPDYELFHAWPWTSLNRYKRAWQPATDTTSEGGRDGRH